MFSPWCETVDAAFKDDFEKFVRNSDLFETEAGSRGLIYDDTETVSYVKTILGRILGTRADSLPMHVHILRDPSLNAFVMPNNTMYIHSGLLTRFENEAQLAFVLAHEWAHIHQHHLWHGIRSTVRKVEMAEWVSTLGTAVTAGASSSLQIGSQLGLAAILSISISGFSREQEREADEVGFTMMAKAEYDVREATTFFDMILKEFGDQSAFATFFYGSHPRHRKRKEYLSRLIEKHRPSDDTATAYSGDGSYLKRMEPLRRLNAKKYLAHKMPFSALGELSLYDTHEMGDLEIPLLRGKAHSFIYSDYEDIEKIQIKRKSKNLSLAELLPRNDHYQRAASYFGDVIKADSQYAEAYKEMGLLNESKGEHKLAIGMYQTYMDIASDSGSIRFIGWKIRNLNKKLETESEE
ncbi:M48 family metalloprotease [bacterium]|nr:M48 family metalloprotease [bacterium]